MLGRNCNYTVMVLLPNTCWVVLVSIYMFVDQKNIFESYFSDRLTFSNIHGRTSCQIYTLALPLLSLETFSSSSKSMILLYIAHLALFVWMDDTITAPVSIVI